MAKRERRTEGGGLAGLVFGVLLACIFGFIGQFFGLLPVAANVGIVLVAGALGWRYGDAFFSWVLERLRYIV